MKKISAALYEFGRYKAAEVTHNPYPDTNILYRVLKEGDVQNSPSRDKILGYDPKYMPQRVVDINLAWHTLPKKQKTCIFGKYVMTSRSFSHGSVNNFVHLTNFGATQFCG